MKKGAILILAVFLLVSPGIISVYAPAPQQFPPAFLKGTRINILTVDPQTINSNEQSFVIHGWVAGDKPWKDLTPAERKAWKKEATFELWINGEMVNLKKWKHKYKEYENPAGDVYYDVMVILFYVQFDANQFVPGDYEFTGTWTDPDGYIYKETHTFTFI